MGTKASPVRRTLSFDSRKKKQQKPQEEPALRQDTIEEFRRHALANQPNSQASGSQSATGGVKRTLSFNTRKNRQRANLATLDRAAANATRRDLLTNPAASDSTAAVPPPSQKPLKSALAGGGGVSAGGGVKVKRTLSWGDRPRQRSNH